MATKDAVNVLDLSKCHSRFAVSLLQLLENDQHDTFFSPLSISVVLSMLYAGADQTTAVEINKAMFAGMKEAQVHQLFHSTMATLNRKSDEYILLAANRLYSASDFKVLQTFIDVLAKQYFSEFRQVDFVKHSEEARLEINKWVAETTRDKIKDLLAKGVINEATRLVLVNAMYFKGNWQDPFDAELTTKLTFHIDCKTHVEVDMMIQNGETFKYHENNECQVLHMPYAQHHMSMVIILPKEKFGLNKFVKELTGEKLLTLIDTVHKRELTKVQVPKFKLEQTFELNDVLPKLGITEMFNPEKANFGRIIAGAGPAASAACGEPKGGPRLFVSNVIHKSFIEVNEKGSEAAAATAAVMMLTAMQHPAPLPSFIADHPFLFAIWDIRLCAPLFMGTVKTATAMK